MAFSAPTSVKTGPVTTNALVLNRYLIFHFILFWLSFLPVINSTAGWILLIDKNAIFIMFYSPIILIIDYFEFVFSAMFWSWLFHKILCIIHRPQEGIFERSSKNADYRYWCMRAMVKKFLIWVIHNFPFPWMDIIIYKMFGNKISWKVGLFDAWIDAEMIDIGDGSTIGQGAVLQSSMITRENLILKRIHIGKNVIIGAHSVIGPGTIIDDNVIVGALSLTTVEQHLESNWIYVGRPAQKYREIGGDSKNLIVDDLLKEKPNTEE